MAAAGIGDNTFYRREKSMRTEWNTFNSGVWAVSYTHLDVYKRQAWDVAFVAESCQGIHFRCRYGAFVDNGVFYKAIEMCIRDRSSSTEVVV